MGEFVLITDSTSDLSIHMINKFNIEVLPLHFSLGGKTFKDYSDEKEITRKEFYNRIRQGETSVTSQINPEDFIKAFKPHLEKQIDILYIAFSSGLSGTYSSACMASNELKEIYPDRRIIIIDSLCASLGEGLLVYLAALEKQKGMSIDQLAKWVENKKLQICHWFTVDDLHHLYRGGRVSSASAFFGSMLGIKPILHVDKSGKLVLVSKSRGRKRSFEVIIQKMEQFGLNLQNQEIFISHGDCKEDAENMAELIKKKFNVKNIFINMIGPVIGSHSGPGTLAVFFVGNER